MFSDKIFDPKVGISGKFGTTFIVHIVLLYSLHKANVASLQQICIFDMMDKILVVFFNDRMNQSLIKQRNYSYFSIQSFKSIFNDTLIILNLIHHIFFLLENHLGQMSPVLTTFQNIINLLISQFKSRLKLKIAIIEVFNGWHGGHLFAGGGCRIRLILFVTTLNIFDKKLLIFFFVIGFFIILIYFSVILI